MTNPNFKVKNGLDANADISTPANVNAANINATSGTFASSLVLGGSPVATQAYINTPKIE